MNTITWYAEQPLNPSDYALFDSLYDTLSSNFPSLLTSLEQFKQTDYYPLFVDYLYRFNRTELCSYKKGDKGVISHGFSVKKDFLSYIQNKECIVTNNLGEQCSAYDLYLSIIEDLGEDFPVVYGGESDKVIPQSMTEGFFSMAQDNIERKDVSISLSHKSAYHLAKIFDDALSKTFPSSWGMESAIIRDAFIRPVINGYRMDAYTCLEGYRPIIYARLDDLTGFFNALQNENDWIAELKTPLYNVTLVEERFDVDFEPVDLSWAFAYLATQCTLAYEGEVITPFDVIDIVQQKSVRERVYDYHLGGTPISFDVVYPIPTEKDTSEDEEKDDLKDYIPMKKTNLE